MIENGCISSILSKQVDRQPDSDAFIFYEYDRDFHAEPQKLTWSQVHFQSCVIAAELRALGSIGDRVAIIAPQGIDYVISFLGALQAGFIAVPLPVPHFSIHDQRMASALQSSSSSIILTTSAVVDNIREFLRVNVHQSNLATPDIIVVDSLDLHTRRDLPISTPATSDVAYLQYTSGSTRAPAGVVISHKNIIANLEQIAPAYFDSADSVPSGNAVSWLPFYHDMGLILGILAPVFTGRASVLLSPMAFLRRPSRWIRLLAEQELAVSAAPNFALELTTQRVSDSEMIGVDLANVHTIISGGERVHPKTVDRFSDRFSRYNLQKSAIRPSYGLAEATLYVTSAGNQCPPKTVQFSYARLADGEAIPSSAEAEAVVDLISHGKADKDTVRIVNPETNTENSQGVVGEIWVQGENVAAGYWNDRASTARVFHGELFDAGPDTSGGYWLKTGDLGVVSDEELFILSRIKDSIIVDGRNHYPDDIEATIQEISGGRVAAIPVQNDSSEHVVAIVELKVPARASEAGQLKIRTIKKAVLSAVSKSHGLSVKEIVFVPPGALPITTSGKVRRSACGEAYHRNQFTRLDS